jgi:hypothetical protein
MRFLQLVGAFAFPVWAFAGPLTIEVKPRGLSPSGD